MKGELLQRFLNSNSNANGHTAMGEQCKALRVEIPATCRWQVATLPMGAPMQQLLT